MHANHQHFLVIGAIEDADPSPLGKTASGAPEEIMLQFFYARLFEGVHLAARRIDSGHNVANHSVLARRIHALKYEQQGIAVRGVVKLLQGTQLRHVLLQDFLIFRLGLVVRLHRGRPLCEFYLVPGLHPEIFGSDFHSSSHPRALSPDSDKPADFWRFALPCFRAGNFSERGTCGILVRQLIVQDNIEE